MLVDRILYVLVFIYGVKSDYTVPSSTLEALKKGGFRVYIPDACGIALFAFHANINNNIRIQQPGSINGETTERTHGFWILEFNNKLNVGDVVNYWTLVSANNGDLMYKAEGARIKISRLFDSYTALQGRCHPLEIVLNGGDSACGGKVILQDKFDRSAINTNLWKVEHRIPTYTEPNIPFNSYENRVATRFTRDNKLYLKPNAASEVFGILNLTDGCTGVEPQECFYERKSTFLLPPVRSSKLVSRASFKYGRIDIRAQLPRGDWIFPIVQLEPVQKDSSSPSKIMIAYSRGNNQLKVKDPADIDVPGLSGNDIGSHLLLAGPTSEVDEPERSKRLIFKYTDRPFYDGFHTYSLLWKKDELRFFVDSEEYGSVSLNSNDMENFNREHVVSLGVGVGGLYDFPDGTMSGDKEKPWSNYDRHAIKQFYDSKSTWLQTWDEERSCLVVDYIRVTAPCYESVQMNSTTKPPPSNKNLCQEGQTTVNGKRSCKGEIVFQESFNELSTSNWKKEKKFAGEPDYEFVLYQDNATNLYVKDNILHIKPTLLEDAYGKGFATNSQGIDLGVTCTGFYGTDQCVQKPRAWVILPPVMSAQISTMDYFSFKYGIVEIRAKLPKGDWIYPDISLVSRSELYGPGHESGRIRIAVARGNAEYDRYLFGGCIFGYSQIARTIGMKRIASKQPWTDDFHTYKLQWKPDSITFSVDDQVYGTVTPPSGGFAANQRLMEIDPLVAERWAKGSILAPFDHEMFLTLGVGVGGQVHPDISEVHKPWTSGEPKAQLNFYKNKNKWYNTWNDDSELLVDYIKVWAI